MGSVEAPSPLRLVVDQLRVARGGRDIIRDLSFSVSGGEALLLKGPNGAGKTTLIRALAGFLAPAAGSITLVVPQPCLWQDGGDADREVAEQCHYVGHLNGIKASLTVVENVTFWAEFLGSSPSSLVGNGRVVGDSRAANAGVSPAPARPHKGEGGSSADRVLDALDTFGLMDLADIPAAYLSAGQKRRLGLARLLIAPRPVWLLDEPTVSLDAGNVEILARAIERHLAAGGIAIAATHIPMGLTQARELMLGAAPHASEAA